MNAASTTIQIIAAAAPAAGAWSAAYTLYYGIARAGPA
jgi:hypothetical protein